MPASIVKNIEPVGHPGITGRTRHCLLAGATVGLGGQTYETIIFFFDHPAANSCVSRVGLL